MTEVEINDGKAMSATTEQETHLPSATAPVPAGDETESFGRALAMAREARGLSQGEVAAQLRLHLRQVRAIEAEDLGALPEGPFVRGFVRNYAKLVDLPAGPLLALLAGRLKPIEPLRADAPGAGVSPVQLAAREHVSRLTVIGGAVTMLALFALLGWWTMRPVAPPPAMAPVVAPAPAMPAASPAAGAAEPDPAPTTRESAPPAAADSAARMRNALFFSFRDRAWVEVRQADGTVLMSRNNDGGTQERLDGTPPYTLVIGNASQVDLEFRGKPVDLAAVASRDDVARLRLE